MRKIFAFLFACLTVTYSSFAADFEPVAGHDGIWRVSADGKHAFKTTDPDEWTFYQWARGSVLAPYIPQVFSAVEKQGKKGIKVEVEMENLLYSQRGKNVRVLDLKLGSSYTPDADEEKITRMLEKYEGTTYLSHKLIIAGIKEFALPTSPTQASAKNFDAWFSQPFSSGSVVDKDQGKDFDINQLNDQLRSFFEGDETHNNGVTPVLEELRGMRRAIVDSHCALQGSSLLFIITDQPTGKPRVTVKLIDFANAKMELTSEWEETHAEFLAGFDYVTTFLGTLAPSKPGLPTSSSSLGVLSPASLSSSSLQQAEEELSRPQTAYPGRDRRGTAPARVGHSDDDEEESAI